MQAQVQAAAVQHLPRLNPYSGEKEQDEDDGFERWLELFEERAKLAGWSSEQRLYQLKLLLVKNAGQVFRLLAKEDRSDYDKATQALRKRFKRVDIEELRGLEFHHKSQGEESVEQLGIDLQCLGKKAFPSTHGKDFDRILKGRFFQALRTKWQRKLGAPKAEESFQQLYDRARMAEEHEKQFVASAASKSESQPAGKKRTHQSNSAGKPTGSRPEENQKSTKPEDSGARSQTSQPPRTCFWCKEPGHLVRDCPKRKGSEARGRSAGSRTATLEAGKAVVDAATLTEEQLEEMLAERRLESEKELLKDVSITSTVTTSQYSAEAVGPTVYADIHVDGILVKAMIDTGAQSTIVSRSLLHAIG